ncbi:MAG: hypothetical protein QG608_1904 [Actinomycetota bacterium]|nr:hypothetical protein [Actinomycetota bacterium]
MVLSNVFVSWGFGQRQSRFEFFHAVLQQRHPLGQRVPRVADRPLSEGVRCSVPHECSPARGSCEQSIVCQLPDCVGCSHLRDPVPGGQSPYGRDLGARGEVPRADLFSQVIGYALVGRSEIVRLARRHVASLTGRFSTHQGIGSDTETVVTVRGRTGQVSRMRWRSWGTLRVRTSGV